MAATAPEILIAFDGSADAEAAVARAGELFPGRAATVLTVWQSVGDVAPIAAAALPNDVLQTSVERLDEASREEADRTAAEGVRLADEAGLQARPAIVRAGGAVSAEIIAEAERRSAGAVVIGSRGRSALVEALLGSVSRGVVHHCPVPVVVARAVGSG